jgi:hypothetical protein
MTTATLERDVKVPTISSKLLGILQRFQAKDSGKLFDPIPQGYDAYLTRCGCGRLLIIGDPSNKISDYGEHCNNDHMTRYSLED